MKCFRRYLSALLLCVLLLGAFSVTANAETVDIPPYHIYARSMLCSWAQSSCLAHTVLIFYPNNGTAETKPSVNNNYTTAQVSDRGFYRLIDYTIATDDGSPLMKKGRNATVNFSKIYNSIKMTNTVTSEQFQSANVHMTTVSVTYTDNTTEIISTYNLTSNIDYQYSTIEFSFTPNKDVKSIFITFGINLYNYLGNWADSDKVSMDFTFGEVLGDNTHILSIEQQSEESGLLDGILGWIRNIYDTVINGFADMMSGIQNGFSMVFQTLSELPAKIWTAISDGLKELFVPDEQYMADYSTNWDELLSSRFGAVYQSGTIIVDFWECIEDYDEKDTISIPTVSLSSVGIPFEFGGYDVQIVPNRFRPLAATAQIISTIICTMLFISGLRKRYDEVMGVEQ